MRNPTWFWDILKESLCICLAHHSVYWGVNLSMKHVFLCFLINCTAAMALVFFFSLLASLIPWEFWLCSIKNEQSIESSYKSQCLLFLEFTSGIKMQSEFSHPIIGTWKKQGTQVTPLCFFLHLHWCTRSELRGGMAKYIHGAKPSGLGMPLGLPVDWWGLSNVDANFPCHTLLPSANWVLCEGG